jgi:uncharacterized membrane protein YfcA
MDAFLLAAAGGFAAALVDGSLGMGFGPTSSTLLLGAGVSPLSTATTVNLAKIATGVVSGGTHWRLGNLDRATVRHLTLFGVVGAIIGAGLLAVIDEDVVRPVLAALLLLTGIRLLVRSAHLPSRTAPAAREKEGTGHGPSGQLSLVAVGGGMASGLIGSWGPVVTPYLLHRRMTPRVVVGSVNAAEVAVAVAAAGSLLTSSGSRGLVPEVVAGMLIGGVVAAPVAARVVHHLPPRLLGLVMGSALVGSQLSALLASIGMRGPTWVAGMVAAAAGAWLGRDAVTGLSTGRQPTVDETDPAPVPSA